jgi:hypothetical protein
MTLVAKFGRKPRVETAAHGNGSGHGPTPAVVGK